MIPDHAGVDRRFLFVVVGSLLVLAQHRHQSHHRSYVGVLEAGIPPLRLCKIVLAETRSQLPFSR